MDFESRMSTASATRTRDHGSTVQIARLLSNLIAANVAMDILSLIPRPSSFFVLWFACGSGRVRKTAKEFRAERHQVDVRWTWGKGGGEESTFK